METFFTFAFGKLGSQQEFLDLFQAVQDENDIKKMQSLIVQVSGLETNNFDNLACALVELKASQPEFVYKTLDLIICECISDLKVKHFYIYLCAYNLCF